MLVDIRSVDIGATHRLKFKHTFKPPKAYNVSTDDVTIDFDGSIINRMDHFQLNGAISADIDMACSCCLENIRVTIQVDISEKFSDSQEDGEFFSYLGDTIDLDPAIQMNLLLNIPYKVICRDDCKGLCPACGANKNLGDCGCDTAQTDPRFDVLKSLFPEDEQ